MAEQAFDRDSYEMIYVEQKRRQCSDDYNHALGLESLGDVVARYRGRFSVKVLYLDESDEAPYHLGRAVNCGIQEARGDIISVMDGDTLVQPDFLHVLEGMHRRGDYVINLYRHMALYPVGVRKYKDWTKARVTLKQCLQACKTVGCSIPKHYGNKGPLISAKRAAWEAVGGYDEHPIFSTAASIAGGDVCRRLEMALGAGSVALPGQYCVHPWHPIGYARKTKMEYEGAVAQLLRMQKDVVSLSEKERINDLTIRQSFADDLLRQNPQLLDQIVEEERRLIASGSDFFDLNKPVYDNYWKYFRARYLGV